MSLVWSRDVFVFFFCISYCSILIIARWVCTRVIDLSIELFTKFINLKVLLYNSSPQSPSFPCPADLLPET